MSSALLDEGAGDIDPWTFSAGWKKLRRKCHSRPVVIIIRGD